MARTAGVAMLEQINDGRIQQEGTAEIKKARDTISVEIEELLEVGARIRPLYVGKERIGWVRGVHLSERKQLKRYVHDHIELLTHVVLLGTSISKEYMRSLSAVELRGLLRVVTEMTNSDLRLYPFMSPFVTTSTSEQLWHAHGRELTAVRKRKIEMPDEATITLLSAPDQARLWATLCTYRESAKVRLDASMNSLMILRPWAGKGADGLAAELKHTAKSLLPDAIEPWTEAVETKRAINLDDGWAHGEDDSRDGIMRELHGMMNNDRHEQIIAKMEAQARAKLEEQTKNIEAKIQERGGPGFIEQKRQVLTEAQMRERIAEMQKDQANGLRQAEELGSNNIDRLARYL